MFLSSPPCLTNVFIVAQTIRTRSCVPIRDGWNVNGRVLVRETARTHKLVSRVDIADRSGRRVDTSFMMASYERDNCRRVASSNTKSTRSSLPFGVTIKRSLASRRQRAKSIAIRDLSGRAVACCSLPQQQPQRQPQRQPSRDNVALRYRKLGARLRKLRQGTSTFAKVMSAFNKLNLAISLKSVRDRLVNRTQQRLSRALRKLRRDSSTFGDVMRLYQKLGRALSSIRGTQRAQPRFNALETTEGFQLNTKSGADEDEEIEGEDEEEE